ncbi:MAG: preprotein translocase subunit SecG [Bdellovibrionales bacterium]
MQNVLLVVQLILAVALIGVIMIQRTAQDGGGLMGGGGGGTMGGLFTARGSANLLTRTTAILAVLFILNSLALGAMASSQHRKGSLIDQIAPVTVPAEENKATKVPVAPKAPVTPRAAPAAHKAPAAPKASEAPHVPVAPPQVPLAQ